ncbi:MAG TPA: diguanylate cyclase [Paraburkholderia sp.]|jgi:diguanylate cyclase (GGDEF)-like protein
MAAFMSNQLDFIFFFYGLAFILLGVTCLAIARSKIGERRTAWGMLAGFGFLHGLGEWLDLSALIVGDGPAFAAMRTAVMTLSFVLLLEFARSKAIGLGPRLPGRWIHVLPVTLVALVGVAYGVTSANVAARYAIGFSGALAASLVFARQAKAASGAARRFTVLAAAGFLLYAVVAGIVVPDAPFWPANIVNYRLFSSLTGIPVQFVRGLLACWLSFSVWGIFSQQIAADISSARYTAYVRRHLAWTLVAMGAILLCGWALTEYLGGIYRRNVQQEARADIDLLASRLAGETATVEGMVKALAGSPSVLPLLQGAHARDDDAGRATLKLDVESSGARQGYLLDASGAVVAASNGRTVLGGVPDRNAASNFRKSITGKADYQFVFDAATGALDYYASYPVRESDGSVVGVAVLAKSLDAFEADLRQFDRPYFFADPRGVVVMTNRPDARLRHLWPVAADGSLPRSPIVRGRARLSDRPMLEREIVDGSWTNVDDDRNYVRRRFVGETQWSLVVLKPTHEIFASRFLGIVITLLVTIMALIYLVGRGRWVHDEIETGNRIRLQQQAIELGLQASTDPLTGLHNRLMLDKTLADEIERSDRYRTPLSLVLFDVDHFKRINDTYGHPVGDKVLVQLSRFVPDLLRKNDFLARWGGEEFLMLAPGVTGPMAFQAADKLRDAIGHVVFAEAGSVTCSFGVAEYEAGESAAELIARADGALYRAKANGRNQVVLAPQRGMSQAAPASANSL